jgi:hypothetical protein
LVCAVSALIIAARSVRVGLVGVTAIVRGSENAAVAIAVWSK